MDYKTTLLMNKSNFEMRGNLNQKEPVLVKKWEEQKVYENMNLNRKDAIVSISSNVVCECAAILPIDEITLDFASYSMTPSFPFLFSINQSRESNNKGNDSSLS